MPRKLRRLPYFRFGHRDSRDCKEDSPEHAEKQKEVLRCSKQASRLAGRQEDGGRGQLENAETPRTARGSEDFKADTCFERQAFCLHLLPSSALSLLLRFLHLDDVCRLALSSKQLYLHPDLNTPFAVAHLELILHGRNFDRCFARGCSCLATNRFVESRFAPGGASLLHQSTTSLPTRQPFSTLPLRPCQLRRLSPLPLSDRFLAASPLQNSSAFPPSLTPTTPTALCSQLRVAGAPLAAARRKQESRLAEQTANGMLSTTENREHEKREGNYRTERRNWRRGVPYWEVVPRAGGSGLDSPACLLRERQVSGACDGGFHTRSFDSSHPVLRLKKDASCSSKDPAPEHACLHAGGRLPSEVPSEERLPPPLCPPGVCTAEPRGQRPMAAPAGRENRWDVRVKQSLARGEERAETVWRQTLGFLGIRQERRTRGCSLQGRRSLGNARLTLVQEALAAAAGRLGSERSEKEKPKGCPEASHSSSSASDRPSPRASSSPSARLPLSSALCTFSGSQDSLGRSSCSPSASPIPAPTREIGAEAQTPGGEGGEQQADLPCGEQRQPTLECDKEKHRDFPRETDVCASGDDLRDHSAADVHTLQTGGETKEVRGRRKMFEEEVNHQDRIGWTAGTGNEYFGKASQQRARRTEEKQAAAATVSGLKEKAVIEEKSRHRPADCDERGRCTRPSERRKHGVARPRLLSSCPLSSSLLSPLSLDASLFRWSSASRCFSPGRRQAPDGRTAESSFSERSQHLFPLPPALRESGSSSGSSSFPSSSPRVTSAASAAISRETSHSFHRVLSKLCHLEALIIESATPVTPLPPLPYSLLPVSSAPLPFLSPSSSLSSSPSSVSSSASCSSSSPSSPSSSASSFSSSSPLSSLSVEATRGDAGEAAREEAWGGERSNTAEGSAQEQSAETPQLPRRRAERFILSWRQLNSLLRRNASSLQTLYLAVDGLDVDLRTEKRPHRGCFEGGRRSRNERGEKRSGDSIGKHSIETAKERRPGEGDLSLLRLEAKQKRTSYLSRVDECTSDSPSDSRVSPASSAPPRLVFPRLRHLTLGRKPEVYRHLVERCRFPSARSCCFLLEIDDQAEGVASALAAAAAFSFESSRDDSQRASVPPCRIRMWTGVSSQNRDEEDEGEDVDEAEKEQERGAKGEVDEDAGEEERDEEEEDGDARREEVASLRREAGMAERGEDGGRDRVRSDVAEEEKSGTAEEERREKSGQCGVRGEGRQVLESRDEARAWRTGQARCGGSSCFRLLRGQEITQASTHRGARETGRMSSREDPEAAPRRRGGEAGFGKERAEDEAEDEADAQGEEGNDDEGFADRRREAGDEGEEGERAAEGEREGEQRGEEGEGAEREREETEEEGRGSTREGATARAAADWLPLLQLARELCDVQELELVFVDRLWCAADGHRRAETLFLQQLSPRVWRRIEKLQLVKLTPQLLELLDARAEAALTSVKFEIAHLDVSDRGSSRSTAASSSALLSSFSCLSLQAFAAFLARRPRVYVHFSRFTVFVRTRQAAQLQLLARVLSRIEVSQNLRFTFQLPALTRRLPSAFPSSHRSHTEWLASSTASPSFSSSFASFSSLVSVARREGEGETSSPRFSGCACMGPVTMRKVKRLSLMGFHPAEHRLLDQLFLPDATDVEIYGLHLDDPEAAPACVPIMHHASSISSSPSPPSPSLSLPPPSPSSLPSSPSPSLPPPSPSSLPSPSSVPSPSLPSRSPFLNGPLESAASPLLALSRALPALKTLCVKNHDLDALAVFLASPRFSQLSALQLQGHILKFTTQAERVAALLQRHPKAAVRISSLLLSLRIDSPFLVQSSQNLLLLLGLLPGLTEVRVQLNRHTPRVLVWRSRETGTSERELHWDSHPVAGSRRQKKSCGRKTLPRSPSSSAASTFCSCSHSISAASSSSPPLCRVSSSPSALPSPSAFSSASVSYHPAFSSPSPFAFCRCRPSCASPATSSRCPPCGSLLASPPLKKRVDEQQREEIREEERPRWSDGEGEAGEKRGESGEQRKEGTRAGPCCCAGERGGPERRGERCASRREKWSESQEAGTDTRQNRRKETERSGALENETLAAASVSSFRFPSWAPSSACATPGNACKLRKSWLEEFALLHVPLESRGFSFVCMREDSPASRVSALQSTTIVYRKHSGSD
ncbi:hypothetical protein TGCAST_278815 [Toxoplasma gondii CAST]|uniref:Uncharacterized protein n=1 Tax=Toxoplasma gondii CAST TaxID=943122 RepID=A0A3R7YPS4_TOXGO|nr:hypothetical protein TGCAST_278815 [Toxoplasma gondii CAST]